MIFPVNRQQLSSGNKLNNDRDIFWMQQAIELAKTAAQNDEVPVGAVLVANDVIIGEGWNRPIQARDPSAHAEMLAIRAGAKHIQNYRLIHSTLYVTLEPCLMCMGAIAHARVERVVFGAFDKKYGIMQRVAEAGIMNHLNHQTEYQGGILAKECGILLSNFFQLRRMDKMP